MTLLDEAFEERKLTEAADLVLERLSGDQLDSAFALGMGEFPEDILIQLFYSKGNDEQFRTFYCSVLNYLAEKHVHPLITSDSFELQNSIPKCFWLPRFLRLASLTTSETLKDKLYDWLLRLQPLQEQAFVASLFLEAIRAAGPLLSKYPHFRTFLAGLISQKPPFMHEVAHICATSDPVGFCRTGLREYVDTSSHAQTLNNSHEFVMFTDCVQHLVRSTVVLHSSPATTRSDGGTIIEALAKELSRILRDKANEECGYSLRGAFMKACALGGMPAGYSVSIEQSYWEEHAAPNIFRDDRCESLRRRESLNITFFFKEKPSDSPRRTIHVNQLPYGEAAFLRLWCWFVELHTGVSIKIIPDYGWEEVGRRLYNGDLDLAVYNDAIIPPNNREMNFQKAPGNFFVFSDYDLLVSASFLREYASCMSNSRGSRSLATQLLDGLPYRAELAKRKETDALRDLLLRGRITVPIETGIDQPLSRFCKKHLGIKLDDCEQIQNGNSDDGLASLLDEHSDVYFGGAIHSHYAQSVFSERVRLLTTTPTSTRVSLFSNAEFYNSHSKFVRRAGALHRQVTQMWASLSQPKPSGELLHVQEDLVQYVNSNRNLVLGFAPTFHDLRSILDHSKLSKWKNYKDPVWKTFAMAQKREFKDARNIVRLKSPEVSNKSQSV